MDETSENRLAALELMVADLSRRMELACAEISSGRHVAGCAIAAYNLPASLLTKLRARFTGAYKVSQADAGGAFLLIAQDPPPGLKGPLVVYKTPLYPLGEGVWHADNPEELALRIVDALRTVAVRL